MKLLFLFILFFSLLLPTSALTLKSGTSITVEEAKEYAKKHTKNIKKSIDITQYDKYLKDKNFEENISSSSKIKFNDRKISFFYLDNKEFSYSVIYNSKPNLAIFYNQNGDFDGLELLIKRSYPQKTVSYDKNGNLDGFSISYKAGNIFGFNKNWELRSHWIQEKGYDISGNHFGTRIDITD